MTGLVLIRRSTVEELLVVCRSTVCELSVESLPIDGRQILGEAVQFSILPQTVAPTSPASSRVPCLFKMFQQIMTVIVV